MTSGGQNELRRLRRSFIRMLLSPVALAIGGIFFHFDTHSLFSAIAVVLGTLVVGLRSLMLKPLQRSIRKHLAAMGDYSDVALVRGFAGQRYMAALPFHFAATTYLIAHILETDWWIFSGGIVFALLWISQIPTTEGAERWLAEERTAAADSDLVMKVGDSETIVQKQSAGLQITIGALLVGAAFFAGVAAYMRPQVHFKFGSFPVFSIVAVGMALMILIFRPFVLSGRARAARCQLDQSAAALDAAWMPIFGDYTITGATLVEGPIFMFFITYVLEGEWWTLAGGIALMGLMAIFHFPTRERANRWIAQQRQAVQLVQEGR
jgi:hypothetical protein